jgi:hypothetical protein
MGRNRERIMKLTAHVREGRTLDIRPARGDRAWLAGFHDGFAYGCLPMIMANQHGWEICSPVSFTAVWNGGDSKGSLAILPDEPGEHGLTSYFGKGILTFSFPAIFSLEPGYDLMLQGPANRPVDGASPLSGLIEVDWLISSAAMHWQLTRANHAVRFHKGDPLAVIFPVKRAELEAFAPDLRPLADDPERDRYIAEWRRSRNAFNEALRNPESPEFQQRWPGHYRRGTDMEGNPGAPDHRTRQRLKPFATPGDNA